MNFGNRCFSNSIKDICTCSSHSNDCYFHLIQKSINAVNMGTAGISISIMKWHSVILYNDWTGQLLAGISIFVIRWC